MDENNTVDISETCLAPKNQRKFPIINVPKINKQCKYIALIVLDTSVNFYHGLFYNIPANTKNINLNKLSEIGYVQSNRGEKYTVMCPPQGTGIHTYLFTFYYLNEFINPTQHINKKILIDYLDTHSIEKKVIKKYFGCPPDKNCHF